MKKIGLQLFSVRDHLTNAENVYKTFQILAKMGYTSVQTAGVYDFMTAEEYAEAARSAGIEICGTHYDWNRIKADIENTVAYHKSLGTTNIGIGGMRYSENKVSCVEEFIKEFNDVARKYAEYGFKLTYHNHAHEFVKLEDGKTIFDHLIEGLDPEFTKFVLDVYWCQFGGIDVRAMISRLKGRIDILHIKDMKFTESVFNEIVVNKDGKPVISERRISVPSITEIGTGNINFADIIPHAEKCGVSYFIVEDDRAPETGDSLAAVKKSADHVRFNFFEK